MRGCRIIRAGFATVHSTSSLLCDPGLQPSPTGDAAAAPPARGRAWEARAGLNRLPARRHHPTNTKLTAFALGASSRVPAVLWHLRGRGFVKTRAARSWRAPDPQLGAGPFGTAGLAIAQWDRRGPSWCASRVEKHIRARIRATPIACCCSGWRWCGDDMAAAGVISSYAADFLRHRRVVRATCREATADAGATGPMLPFENLSMRLAGSCHRRRVLGNKW